MLILDQKQKKTGKVRETFSKSGGSQGDFSKWLFVF